MSYSFMSDLPRYVFFTGKGGVGKTSIACATAVNLADSGRRVLLVSTDPASNVAQVLDQTIGNQITRIAAVDRLSAIEIDPEAAAEAYREKIIGPVRGLLPEAELASITEQLSGSCTTEIASFNEFTDLLTNVQGTAEHDHVVFDTAPTGHTIRLLQLPGEWTAFLDEGKGDASCLGPMSGLDKTRTQYAQTLAKLSDPAATALVLVTRAQKASLDEAARTAEELAALGITEQRLVINAVLDEAAGNDALARAVIAREQQAIGNMPLALRALGTSQIPLRASGIVGLDNIRALLAVTNSAPPNPLAAPSAPSSTTSSIADMVDELAQDDHGLVMCMGKGGVGKTTAAAAIALALAHKGKRVHLSTTDPAGRLDQSLGEAVENLTTSRIDPEEATRAYRDRVLATKGSRLDEAGKAQLLEDLRSPCTEEVAVFGEFSHLVSRAKEEFVVIDTAPTGHTLLLMDATGSYHREIVRGMGPDARIVTPLMRLQDPDLTRIVIVTLPDATPVQEAADLDADLRRAGIVPWGWVVNQAISQTGTQHPLLAARAEAEAPHIATVNTLATRVATIPLLLEEPTEPALLHRLATH
ncbi:arsenical pump-driving ATPase [Tessaracoccus flavescens]|uniref:Arsenical pump-driving ATPase n=2 Tax=Tessaracoccus flavescens TaxID=399497 RepID=A0A1Q2CXP5_9ACTN|nr:arsenical pump-driving ATPase [Tessaracoccus flavescens]